MAPEASAKCIYRNPDAPLATLPDKPDTPTKPPEVPQQVVVGPSETPAIPGRSSILNPGFAYFPPGDLLPYDKGRGRAGDRRVYAPKMIFPIKLQPGADASPPGRHAFMNSQIWNFGGGGYGKVKGPGGAECNPANYNPLLQRDNFCEVRGWEMPMCPAGVGHQGQDIRPPKCEDNKWEAVAVVDGTITKVTSNTTVHLKGEDGTLYEYLHMHPASIRVKKGQQVTQGDVLGRISNYMNGSPGTTRHLHFSIEQTITVDGEAQRVEVPLYTSLIAAYRHAKGLDRGIDPNGNLIIDPLLEIGAEAQKDTPPITAWTIPNVAGNDGRAITPIALSKYFRPRTSTTRLRYAAVGLPSGIVLNPETGEIKGMFERGASRGGLDGAYTVTVNVDDGAGGKAQQSFVLSALYSPPSIGTATRGKFFKDGTRVLIDAGAAFVNYSDVPLTFSATGLPTGVAITPATGRISGRLSKTASKEGEDGVYTISVAASDGKSTVTQRFTLTAEAEKEPGPQPALPPPVVVEALASATVFAGEPITPIETANGFRAYSFEQIKFQAASLPIGLAIDPVSGRISGTPAQETVKGGDRGTYTVKIIADNGEGGTATQSFVLTIRNKAPVVVIPTINKIFKEGESVELAVAAAFEAPDMSLLSYSVTGLPPGIRFDAETGRVTGTIAAGASAAQPGGVYSVVATADDGRGGRVSQTFAVTIEADKAPPTVVGPIPATAGVEGTPFDTVRAAASFKPGIVGNTLTYAAEGLPPGLSIDEVTGDITGALTVGTTGDARTKPFSVRITATDARIKQSVSQQTTIVVVQAPKSEPAPAPKPEPKPESEPAPKPEPKPEPEPAPKPEPKPEPEPAPKPEPKPEPAPEPKPAEPAKKGWGDWAYDTAKGAWDGAKGAADSAWEWASGFWKKK